MNTMKKKNEWISTMITAFMAEEAANPTTVGAITVGRQVSVVYLDTDKPKIGPGNRSCNRLCKSKRQGSSRLCSPRRHTVHGSRYRYAVCSRRQTLY